MQNEEKEVQPQPEKDQIEASFDKMLDKKDNRPTLENNVEAAKQAMDSFGEEPKVIPMTPAPEPGAVRPPSEIVDNMEYIIEISDKDFNAKYKISPQVQLVAHMIVKQTVEFRLDADSKRAKADKMPMEERQKLIQQAFDMGKMASKLAIYLRKVHKPASKIIMP
jgi:hypothetical protein